MRRSGRSDPVTASLDPYIHHLERSLAKLRSEWTTFRYRVVSSRYRVANGRDGKASIEVDGALLRGDQRGDVLDVRSTELLKPGTRVGDGAIVSMLSVTVGDIERASGPRDVEWLLDGGHRDLRLEGARVISTDPVSGTLTLSDEPPSILLEAGPNAIDVMRELEALRSLATSDDERVRPLRRLISATGDWPSFIAPKMGDDRFLLLTDGDVPGVERQRAFVEKALATPDIMLLEGPPGSGKTTVLSELVVQSVMRGRRVLMVASTHVAVDNLLERLIDPEDALIERAGLIPLRIGDAANVSPSVAPYTVRDVVRTERERMRERLLAIERSPSQQHMLDYLEANGRGSALEELVIDSSNIVCGTTIGVLGSKVVAASGGFDLVIIDEASKTTFHEFMVPASLGSRWVIAGDRMQLSPYVDEDRNVWELRSMSDGVKGFDDGSRSKGLMCLTGGRGPDGPDLWERELGWRMRRLWELRDDPMASGRYERGIEDLLRPCDEPVRRALRKGMGSVNDIAFRSIIDLVEENVPEDALFRRRTLLSHQYRMHPSISSIPRECVYGERALRDPSDMEARREWSFPGPRLAWLDVRGGRAGGDENAREADAVANVIEEFVEWASNDDRHWEVAVLTPYRAQERLIRSRLDRHLPSNVSSDRPSGDVTVRVATVDRYQGHEADLVILSLVRGAGRGIGFMDSTNRTNVALTRARYMLVVVGDRERFLAKDSTPMLRLLAERSGAWR